MHCRSATVTRRGFSLWFAVIIAVLSGCLEDNDKGEMKGLAQPTRSLPIPSSLKLTADELPHGRRELVFAVTPYLAEDAMQDAFEPIAAFVGRKLGVKVRFAMTQTYLELIDLVRNNKVDIVQISPMSYVIAKRDNPGLRLIGSSLSFGTAHYSALIIGRSDVPNNWLDLLKDKAKDHRKFGFVDVRSGSGFLFPYAELMRMGVTPEKDLNVEFTGSHDKSIKMVQDGQLYAAAVSSGTLNAARTGDVIGFGELQILHKAGRIPYDALCTAPGISEEAAAKIAGAFGSLNTKTASGREALRAARGLTGWIKADDEQYDEVREKLTVVEASKFRNWKLKEDSNTETDRKKLQLFRSDTSDQSSAKNPEKATKSGK